MKMQKHSSVLQRLRIAATLLFASFLMCNVALAQNNTLKGKVVSEADGSPIIGATVLVVGTQMGAITDTDGSFILTNAPSSGTLNFSFVGFAEVNAAIGKNKEYNIKLKSNDIHLDDVVVVGYGQMKRKEVTGSVARVLAEDLTKQSTSDLGTAMQGQIAGVNVQASSGEPGSASNIQIRGISSISGDNTPLFVVDGVPYEGDPGISPSEVETIDILKDAASCAVYGTRGAAGVILITTKTGVKGKTKITYDGYYGIQKITSDIGLMNSVDYTYVQAVKNRTGSMVSTDDRLWTSIQTYPANFFNESNLWDVIVNDSQPIQNHSLNISGGSDDVTYNVNANYMDQAGVIINSNYSRYSVRGTVNVKQKKWTINSTVSLKREDQLSPGWNLLQYAYGANPTQAAVDIDADISGNSYEGSSTELSSMSTQLARLLESSTKNSGTYTGNFFVAYDLHKNLQLSTRLGLNYSSSHTTRLKPLFEIYNSDGELISNSNTRSSITETYSESTSTTSETMLNWGKKYGKHDLKFTGVFSVEQYTYAQFYATIYDLTSNETPSLNAGTADWTIGTGSGQWGQDRTTSLVGMLGRFQYSYDEKYMLSASVRRDGSSRFAEANRWGLFPSVSAGWNLSSEKFWKPIKETINSFKFRGSYGTTGNQNFTDYSYAATVINGLDYTFGGEGVDAVSLGSAQTAYANADITWETTIQSNIGIDLAAFGNKLTFSVDYYKSEKHDMLFPLTTPASVGAQSATVTLNVGNMTNQGIEMALGKRGYIKKYALGYSINATFTTNDNVVTSMGESSDMYYFSDGQPVGTSNTADKVTVVAEGYEAGAFFMMPTNGIVNTEQKLYEYQQLVADAQMGDLMYVDQNGDGAISDDDRVYCGSGIPDYELGLSLSANRKGFDISMNWYASLGNEAINGSKIYSYQSGTNSDLVYAWNWNYAESTIPTYYGVSTHDNYRCYADIWVQDASFLRLKNITVGYSLQKGALKKLNLSKLRVYVAADNLWTITKYDGYDPEVGSNGLSKRGLDLGTYPITMQMRAGVQIGF